MTLTTDALAAYDAKLAAEAGAVKAEREKAVAAAKTELAKVLAGPSGPRPTAGMKVADYQASDTARLVVLIVEGLYFAVSRTRRSGEGLEVSLVEDADGWTPVGEVKTLADLGRLLQGRV